MNRLIDILNRIRRNQRLEWLTVSQRKAFDVIQERLRFLDEVNLYGEHGVGKTFLGWVLQACELADYAPRLDDVKPTFMQHTIVIDNLGWRRTEAREALYHCHNLGYHKVVLITKELVQEQMSTIELTLTDMDIAMVIDNLRSIHVIPYSDVPQTLWDLVCPLMRKEGEH